MTREKLRHYQRIWRLSNPQLLARTATSDVYRVTSAGSVLVLKLLTALGEADEANGAAALRYFGGQGAVRLLRHDDHAHLLEYVAGEDLTTLVRKGADEQATAIVAHVLEKLHAPRSISPPQGLRPLRDWFRALFKKSYQDEQHGHYSTYVRAAHTAKMLLADERDICVLHGDIHHENIRQHPQRGWLAIDPKGITGERTYDAANTLCNPLDMPALVENEQRLLKNCAILAEKLSLDHDRLLAFVFAYACLSASWSLEDGDDPSHALKMAALAEPHVRIG